MVHCRAMTTRLTKQLPDGRQVEIEIVNGSATVLLNGKRVGTSGRVDMLSKPIEKNGCIYVAAICSVALTTEERTAIETMLRITKPTPDSISDREAREINRREMAAARGDITQWNHLGVR